jgi:class 3 adenylate cyclase
MLAAAREPVDVALELPGGRTVQARTPAILGRAHPDTTPHPDVDLTEVDPRRQVSRRHARVETDGGHIFITDLGSTNGTWVDERRLPPGGTVTAGPGVHLRLGDVEVRVRAATAGPKTFLETITMAAADIAHRVATNTQGTGSGPVGTVSFLYTDIENSTLLGERLGDMDAAAVWRAHDEIVRHHLRAHGGYEVTNQGDGFLLAFSSTRMALRCAIAIQRTLGARRRADPRTGIAVRMGVHCGEVVSEAGNYHGHHVVITARIGAAARGGEIVASWVVRELGLAMGEIDFINPREVELKGISGTFRVFSVPWMMRTDGAP